MYESFFREIKSELQNGSKVKGHPFHFFTLATTGVDNYARLRTMALRKVSKNLKLTFFTDGRSKKIIHIKENKKVSLLFYHSEKQLQLRIQAMATIKTNREPTKKIWNELGPESKKSYTTKDAPGSPLQSSTVVEYLRNGDYFSIVEIKPYKIEYLKLEKPEHVRIRFLKEDTGWRGEFLVP